MSNPEALIPEQERGIAKEVHHEVNTANEREARAVWERAKNRLLSVNKWNLIADGTSAKFQLCDARGQVQDRQAKEGDLVRIDLPGPHRAEGSGFDWVRLEPLREGSEGNEPWIVMTTRPCPDPNDSSEGTAHFFAEGSSGTFVIRLRGNLVSATHYGRNELPNTEGSLVDSARAVLVTMGAYLGLSDLQWNNLVKGLLEISE